MFYDMLKVCVQLAGYANFLFFTFFIFQLPFIQNKPLNKDFYKDIIF